MSPRRRAPDAPHPAETGSLLRVVDPVEGFISGSFLEVQFKGADTIQRGALGRGPRVPRSLLMMIAHHQEPEPFHTPARTPGRFISRVPRGALTIMKG